MKEVRRLRLPRIRRVSKVTIAIWLAYLLLAARCDTPGFQPPYLICYYPGPDVSEDELMLTDFKVESWDQKVYTTTVLRVSFTITYVGKKKINFGTGGLILMAESPSGVKAPLYRLNIESLAQGESATLVAEEIVLHEEGRWIVWPSYLVYIERGIAAAPIIKNGPDYWHACYIDVSTPPPPTTTPPPITTPPPTSLPPTTTPAPAYSSIKVVIEYVPPCLCDYECIVVAEQIDAEGNVVDTRSMVAEYVEGEPYNIFRCSFQVLQNTMWVVRPLLPCSPESETVYVGVSEAHAVFVYRPTETLSPTVTVETLEVSGRPAADVPSGPVRKLTRRINCMQRVDLSLVARDNEGGSGLHRITVRETMLMRNGSVKERILDEIRIEQPMVYRRELSYSLGPYRDCSSAVLRVDMCDFSGNMGSFELILNISRVPCGCGWSNVFEARFTHYDDIASGDIIPSIAGEEVVIAIDEDADGDNGLFYVYDYTGQLVCTFEAFYTHHDRLIVGEVADGYPGEELIVVANDDGGKLMIYTSYEGESRYGLKIGEFDVRFTKYDGIGVGDVDGDGVNEILIAVDEDKKIYIYSVAEDSSGGLQLASEGTVNIEESVLGWKFDGCRYTYSEDHKGSAYDGFLVGDVMGDGRAEIVMLENRNGDDSEIYVYEYTDGGLIELNVLTARFTKKDGVYLGDVMGDGKLEIVIAIDEDDAVYIYSASLGLLKVQYMRFTPLDGLACGDIDGDGKDEILIVIDEDDKLYVGGVRDEL